MAGEANMDLGSPSTNPIEDSRQENPVSAETKTLLDVFDRGFRRLPKMYGGGLDKRFDSEFPFIVPPWKLGVGRKFIQRISPGASDQSIAPVVLDPINNLAQKTGSDCVGATFMSAFGEITGTPITPELYDGVLETALKDGLAERDNEGTKLFTHAFNVFLTPEFKQQFPSPKVEVVARRGLSLNEVSEIVRTTKEKDNHSYKLFVFLPFSSWTTKGGGHIVTLKEIGPTESTVYDPRNGEKRVLPNAEFNQRWDYANKTAIFVFVK